MKLESTDNPCTTVSTCDEKCIPEFESVHDECVGGNMTSTDGTEVPYSFIAFFDYAQFFFPCTSNLLQFALLRDDIACNDWYLLNDNTAILCSGECTDLCKGMTDKLFASCMEDDKVAKVDGTVLTAKEAVQVLNEERHADCTEHANSLEYKEADTPSSATSYHVLAAGFLFPFLSFLII